MIYYTAYCDKCQEEQERGNLHSVRLYERPGDWLKYDLCPDCYKALKKFLDNLEF